MAFILWNKRRNFVKIFGEKVSFRWKGCPHLRIGWGKNGKNEKILKIFLGCRKRFLRQGKYFSRQGQLEDMLKMFQYLIECRTIFSRRIVWRKIIALLLNPVLSMYYGWLRNIFGGRQECSSMFSTDINCLFSSVDRIDYWISIGLDSGSFNSKETG